MGGGSNPTLPTGTVDGFRGLGQSVKHSLTNLAVSFTNVGGGISTPDSEIASNWSNFSSDSSDNFVQLDVGDPDASSGRVSINHANGAGAGDDDLEDGVEVATEVVEGEDLLQEERSTPSPSFSHDNAFIRAENENTVPSFQLFSKYSFYSLVVCDLYSIFNLI